MNRNWKISSARLGGTLGLTLLGGLLGSVALAQQAPEAAKQEHVLATFPARHMEGALLAPINEATRAGSRIVAVGANGVILLSDDEGKHFRQAKNVPIRSTLTSVSFADAQHGWAAGHWGIILGTTDGGENWSILRKDTSVDQPLFSIRFKNANEGLAVGLWSLMLATTDGGKSWSSVQLPNAPGRNKADLNLMHIFSGRNGQYFITAEQGIVLKSGADWQHWEYLSTGYNGTLWTGTSLPDGKLMVAGLRGSLYASDDDGATWKRADTQTSSSITDIAASNGVVMAVGLDGVTLESADGGHLFRTRQRDDRLSYTALVPRTTGGFAFMSVKGPVDPSKE